MQITPLSPSFNGTNIYVPKNAKANKTKKFLYNEVYDIIKANHVPAVIKNNGIEINATKVVMDKLKELGIKFVDKIK